MNKAKNRTEEIMYRKAKEKGHTIQKGNKGYYVWTDNKDWTDEPDEFYENPRQYLRMYYKKGKHFRNFKPF